MSATMKLRASIVIISETAYKDPSTDKCVPALQDVFDDQGSDKWEVAQTRIVSDDVLMIQRAILQDCEAKINLIITSGGTGFATKDVTPEVSYSINPEASKNCIHGVAETNSSYPASNFKSAH